MKDLINVNLDEPRRYAASLRFLDLFVTEAGARGLVLRDRLDAQSVIWAMRSYDNAPQGWKGDWAEFEAYRSGAENNIADDNPPPRPASPEPTPEPQAGFDPDGLADELLIDAEFFEDIAALLEDKRQIIFYGPPGTGKTFVAKRFSQSLAGTDGVRVVQFHPAYAYEDFVEGYRPTSGEGGVGTFRLVDGPLKRAAALAASRPDQKVVLLIDEINRGNLAKVFGELYFLLEYRSEQIEMQYSAKPFSLPPNLYLIGTMNAADRSIALLDAALRRRFYFVPFFPDHAPIKGLLTRWLTKHAPSMNWISGVVDLANQQLADRHLSIGPSYFMRKSLDDASARRAWQHAVQPYLEEHFFSEPERLAQFDLDELRNRVQESRPADASMDP